MSLDNSDLPMKEKFNFWSQTLNKTIQIVISFEKFLLSHHFGWPLVKNKNRSRWNVARIVLKNLIGNIYLSKIYTKSTDMHFIKKVKV